jgi:CBS domain-containing protein
MNNMTPVSKKGTVARFMETHDTQAYTLRPEDTILDASTGFTADTGRKHSLAVVVDGASQVVGVLSMGDIMLALSRHRGDVVTMTVGEIMTGDVLFARPDDSLPALMEKMAQRNVRHSPVVVDGRLEGIITRKDALEELYRDASYELKYFIEFVFRSGARY